MAAEQRSEAGARQLSEFASHEMRITQGGKIRAWVEFALKFFEACKSPIHFTNMQTNKGVHGCSGE